MSQEQARELLERFRDDPDFRVRVLRAGGARDRLRLLRFEGYDCTTADVARAADVLSGELTATELATVAGGVHTIDPDLATWEPPAGPM